MKSVKVYQLIDGKDEEVGKIHFDGQSLIPEPNVGLLQFIARTPIAGPAGPMTPQQDPETFLAHLHRQYRSAYLRVSKPEEGKEPAEAARLSFAEEIRGMVNG